mmetsp:Transcript_51567/g.124171  ORF Transcript_51567/g.124171 Transcript_51567/m.124171 type:complete len:229 (+) Transcript_51567:279-965(+)
MPASATAIRVGRGVGAFLVAPAAAVSAAAAAAAVAAAAAAAVAAAGAAGAAAAVAAALAMLDAAAHSAVTASFPAMSVAAEPGLAAQGATAGAPTRPFAAAAAAVAADAGPSAAAFSPPTASDDMVSGLRQGDLARVMQASAVVLHDSSLSRHSACGWEELGSVPAALWWDPCSTVDKHDASSHHSHQGARCPDLVVANPLTSHATCFQKQDSDGPCTAGKDSQSQRG